MRSVRSDPLSVTPSESTTSGTSKSVTVPVARSQANNPSRATPSPRRPVSRSRSVESYARSNLPPTKSTSTSASCTRARTHNDDRFGRPVSPTSTNSPSVSTRDSSAGSTKHIEASADGVIGNPARSGEQAAVVLQDTARSRRSRPSVENRVPRLLGNPTRQAGATSVSSTMGKSSTVPGS